MTEQITEEKAPTLEKVQNQFETWRKTRKSRQPIPERLWQAAARLSQNYPTTKIAGALRLNYTQLKKRIDDAKTSPPIIQDMCPTFIELDLGACPASACECMIEIKLCDGSEMKMHFKGDRYFDPLEVCNAFWSKRL